MDCRLNAFFNGTATDFYNVGDDSSSDEEAKSSDDDIDDILKDQQESDNDSFEKEMEMELNKEFLEHRKLHFHMKSNSEQNMEGAPEDAGTNKDNVYDDDYFSSGSEDEDNVGGVSSKSKERRTKQTDDELLYDPNMDEEDENWVKEQREGHQNKLGITSGSNNPVNESEEASTKLKIPEKKSTPAKSANSDAILSCPACLATLCIDCQRHDIYKQQFRAMFVMNCKILTDETLRYEARKDKKRTGKKKQNKDQGASTSTEETADETYNPVQCALCNTEVAVYDKDEIYHFFNVVESLS